MTVFATSYKFDRPALLAIFVIVFAIGSNLYAAGEANRIHLEICKAMNL